MDKPVDSELFDIEWHDLVNSLVGVIIERLIGRCPSIDSDNNYKYPPRCSINCEYIVRKVKKRKVLSIIILEKKHEIYIITVYKVGKIIYRASGNIYSGDNISLTGIGIADAITACSLDKI